MRFTVLGPVEVSAGGVSLPGLAPRHRALLGYLLLHAGTTLSHERLADAMWGAAPPDTARAQIHAAVTAIRRVLRAAGAEETLRTRPAGYVIEPGRLDLAEFTALVSAARSETAPAQAVRRLREALALWRGPAFSGVNADYVESARARLEDRRLAALEHLAELELAAGRHEDLIAELSAELAAHPLRERLARHLMTALHHAGRQADALAVAREYRARLAEEQGLDPTPAFDALAKAILTGPVPVPPAPAPAGPAPVGPAPVGPAPVGPAPVGPAPVGPASAGPLPAGEAAPEPPPAPGTAGAAFLPYDIADFSGRDDELDLLERLLPERDDAVRVVAIDGMAGIGKTALAVHAAHRLAPRFPGGALFVDLRAHTAGHAPLEPGEALEVLLRQLGVPAEAIPAQAAAREELWRGTLAGRRVLIVLDNAADAAQVRPLLPGASGGLVLVTSRRRLADLDAAHALSMEVLPRRHATALFTGIVGERAEAEPAAVAEVLLLCGFLPLAVRIAAARLRHRPRWTVAYLAGRLRDERRRLPELATAERGVAAAFTLSYHQLDPGHRRLFRLLGLHPGRDVEPGAAAALAGLDAAEAEDLLEDLLDVHMLQQHEPGRYRFHDLLRRYAQETAAAEEPAEARRGALDRLLGHHLAAASAAMDVLYPDSAHRRPRVAPPAVPGPAFATPAGALAWLDAERGNLVAAALHAAGDPRAPAHIGPLATTLYRYLYDHAHHDDALLLYGGALADAERREDPAGAGRALTDLGWVHQVRGDHDLARDHFGRALTACRTAGDRGGEARALVGLGRTGTGEEALAANRRALELFRDLGDRFGEAVTLDYLGVVRLRLGRPGEAAALHRDALELFRAIGSRGGEADALDNLGVALLRQGSPEEARRSHRAALELYRRFGYRRGEARALNGLAEAARALGETGEAARLHTAALGLAAELGYRDERARAEEGLAATR
ncbi:AfsR/SARP family transcriptional regulator [Bailinhaonella thermotolerans]|uniref:AfsR/SARP family transcriptional regulator n=1 Tax=Bailinhaonella thermotolerans TaxID=1070861 RepID=UPI00192A5576|nr:BTAD domain-containing putative transcriptional regulator [Bailinhaonella thermotolerans]